MNYKNLFFHAIFINSFLVVTIICSDDRQTRLSACSKAIESYTKFKDDLYTIEGQILMVDVQNCLQDILQHNDTRCDSPTLKKIMQQESATTNPLNKKNLINIAMRLKIECKK